MAKVTRTLERVLRGTSDANIRFADLCSLLQRMGFEERVRGDHHIFSKAGVEQILNLQPRGSTAKPYQVKQVRSVIVEYGLAGEWCAEPISESDENLDEGETQTEGNGQDD